MAITLLGRHIGNLDDRVSAGLWEDTLPTRALGIKTKYPERRDLRPFTLRWVRYKLVPSIIFLVQTGVASFEQTYLTEISI